MNFNFSLSAKKSLTFSLDACYTGFYFWLGNFTLRIGGVDTKNSGYPYIVPTFFGFGFVLPNYFSWHTPFGEYSKPSTGSRTIAKGVRTV